MKEFMIEYRKNQCIRRNRKKQQAEKRWSRCDNPFDQRWSRKFDADDDGFEEDSPVRFRWNAFEWQLNRSSAISGCLK